MDQFVICMTSVVDGRCHWVCDDAAAAGYAGGRGEFEALCGHRLLATPMISPNGPPCPSCARFHQARATLPKLQLNRPHRHRAPGWWRRLIPGATASRDQGGW